MSSSARRASAATSARDCAPGQVRRKARAEAVRLGVSEVLVAELWEQLVEASIAYEMEAFEGREG